MFSDETDLENWKVALKLCHQPLMCLYATAVENAAQHVLNSDTIASGPRQTGSYPLEPLLSGALSVSNPRHVEDDSVS